MFRVCFCNPEELQESCGTISVSSLPCHGEIALECVQSGEYEFFVSNFGGNSSPDCSPGAGDYFRLTEGGTLAYRTRYAAVTGTLTRVP